MKTVKFLPGVLALTVATALTAPAIAAEPSTPILITATTPKGEIVRLETIGTATVVPEPAASAPATPSVTRVPSDTPSGTAGAQPGASNSTAQNASKNASKDDKLVGTENADTLKGKAGVKTLNGRGGNDLIEASGDEVLLIGGAGKDTLSFAGSTKDVKADIGKSKAGKSRLRGFENLLGSPKNDRLLGDKRANVITGGLGKDIMVGRGGADRFVFRTAADSPANEPDVIRNFSSKEKDKIVLSSFAKGKKRGALNFIGDKGFSKKPGQIRFANSALQLDVNGDGKADMKVLLPGVRKLSAQDLDLSGKGEAKAEKKKGKNANNGKNAKTSGNAKKRPEGSGGTLGGGA